MFDFDVSKIVSYTNFKFSLKQFITTPKDSFANLPYFTPVDFISLGNIWTGELLNNSAGLFHSIYFILKTSWSEHSDAEIKLESSGLNSGSLYI